MKTEMRQFKLKLGRAKFIKIYKMMIYKLRGVIKNQREIKSRNKTLKTKTKYYKPN